MIPQQLPLMDALGGSGGTKKRGQVPASSVEAWKLKNAEGRIATVLGELASYAIEYCHKPTSAELTRWYQKRHDPKPWMVDLLEIRRGLADAKAKGLVEHAGKRTCSVANTTAVTWRIKSR